MKYRMALVCYPAEYFYDFGCTLEKNGFEIFWICALNADNKFLLSRGVSSRKIINIHEGFNVESDFDLCRHELDAYESKSDIKFSDIIMMDRLLSKKDWKFSVRFISHIAEKINKFLKNNNIQMLSSWRDTAPQLTAMMVAKSLSIPFVIPTRIRLPQEVYGFCTEHHTDSFIRVRDVASEDYDWAEDFLTAFESKAIAPALKKSTRGFYDVLRLMPSHLRAFLYELRRSVYDINNDFTRYRITVLIAMYIKRRWNLLVYKLATPAMNMVDWNKNYCLYALHTQPESSIDVQASAHSNQLELIRDIARCLPLSCPLYVKVHPTDVDGKSVGFYNAINSIPNVYLLNYSIDSRQLIANAKIIFALTGTIAYEAGLMQKNVIVFARNFFNGLPTVKYCEDLTRLSSLVNEFLIISNSPEEERRKKIVKYLANLKACCFEGEVSRTYGASNEVLSQSDLETVVIAYKTVFKRFTFQG